MEKFSLLNLVSYVLVKRLKKKNFGVNSNILYLFINKVLINRTIYKLMIGELNMTELYTERLRLIPLNTENLTLFINDIKKLQAVLSLEKVEVSLDEEIIDAMKYRLSKVLIDPSNYFWHTNWLIVSKVLNTIVGGIMLKGLPNENGEVIIGYFTIPHYQGNGYMTETIKELTSWILDQPNVIRVIADTEKDNKASHKVLEKNGAELYKETEDLYFWGLSKKSHIC